MSDIEVQSDSSVELLGEVPGIVEEQPRGVLITQATIFGFPRAFTISNRKKFVKKMFANSRFSRDTNRIAKIDASSVAGIAVVQFRDQLSSRQRQLVIALLEKYKDCEANTVNVMQQDDHRRTIRVVRELIEESQRKQEELGLLKCSIDQQIATLEKQNAQVRRQLREEQKKETEAKAVKDVHVAALKTSNRNNLSPVAHSTPKKFKEYDQDERERPLTQWDPNFTDEEFCLAVQSDLTAIAEETKQTLAVESAALLTLLPDKNEDPVESANGVAADENEQNKVPAKDIAEDDVYDSNLKPPQHQEAPEFGSEHDKEVIAADNGQTDVVGEDFIPEQENTALNHVIVEAEKVDIEFEVKGNEQTVKTVPDDDTLPGGFIRDDDIHQNEPVIVQKKKKTLNTFTAMISYTIEHLGGARRKIDPETGRFLPKTTKKTAQTKSAEKIISKTPEEDLILKASKKSAQTKFAEKKTLKTPAEEQKVDKPVDVAQVSQVMATLQIADASAARRHLPMVNLDAFRIGWDSNHIKDSVHEENWLLMAPVMLFLRETYERLPVERQATHAFISAGFFVGTADDNLGYYGGQNPAVLIAPKCAGGHWTLYVVNLASGRTVQYDPYRQNFVHNRNAIQSVREDVRRLKTAVARAFGTSYTDTFELHGVSDFGPMFHQRDAFNCGVYILAVAEQILRGGLFTDFDIHQYRCFVAQQVNPPTAPPILNLQMEILTRYPPSIVRAILPVPYAQMQTPKRRSAASLRMTQEKEQLKSKAYRNRQRSQRTSEDFAKQFNNTPTGSPRGRPSLDLTPDQLRERRAAKHSVTNRARYVKLRAKILDKKQMAEVRTLIKNLAGTCTVGLNELLKYYAPSKSSLQMKELKRAIIFHKYRTICNRWQNRSLQRHLAARDLIKRGGIKIANLLDKILQKPTLSTAKWEELRIIEKIRQMRRPESVAESMTQIKRAHHLAEKLSTMKAIALDQLEKARRQVHNQLQAKIVPLTDQTEEQSATRLIGRMNYHLRGPRENNDQFQAMTKLYPILWREFMGREAIVSEEPIEEESPFVSSAGTTQINEELVDELDAAESEITVVEPNEKAIMQLKPEEVAALNAEALGENNLDQDGAELSEIGAAVLRSVTMIRRCADDCPSIKGSECQIIGNLFGNLVTSTEATVFDAVQVFSETNDELGGTPVEWLSRHYGCYNGIRTLKKRLSDFTRIVTFLNRLNQADANVDLAQLTTFADGYGVPRSIWKNICSDHYDHSTELTAAKTLAKHGATIAAFRRDISLNETHACQVCRLLNRKDELSTIQVCEEVPSSKARRGETAIPKDWLPEELRNEVSVEICRMCRRRVVQLELPPNAIVNGNDVDETPSELKDLNWIEQCLVQLVRPIQKTFHLTDAGGRKTQVKATRGAMVLLPVPVNSTIDHVAETLSLPSSKGLKILVENKYSKKLISLEKVLKALKYLIEVNGEYSHVDINEAFTFTKEEVIFDQPATQERYDALIARTDAENDHLLTQADFFGQPTISNTGAAPPMTTTMEYAVQEYTLKPHKYQPIRLSDAHNADVRCFPQLFPTGRFGINFARRKEMTKRAVFKNKLRNANRTFARNAHFITFAHGLLTQQDITACLGIHARLGKGSLLTAAVKKMVEEEDEHFAQLTSPALKNLRGTAPFWENAKLELKAHVAVFGPPTLFITVNPSETTWPELWQAYADIYKIDVAEVKKNITKFIAEDSYIFTRCIQRRYRMFLKYFLGDGSEEFEGPLGKVSHYFCRIEYQKRGTEHLHLVLWVKDAPGINSSDEDRIAFIDKYVTARMPDEATENELYHLVKDHQMHFQKHTSTCQRFAKYKNKLIPYCRFEFPRPSTGRTVINNSASVVRGIPGVRSKPYSVARRRGDEQFVNDYNPALLMAWRGNIDIQYIMSDVLDVVQYITGYTTKHESQKGTSLLDSLRQTAVNGKDKFKVMMELINQRECGTMELSDLIMGHPLFFFDVGHVFINTNSSGNRTRMLKSMAEIKKQNDSAAAYQANWMDSYYPNRSDELEEFSLFNLMVYYDVVGDKSSLRKRQKDAKRAARSNQKKATADVDESEDEENDMPSQSKKSIFRADFHVNDTASPFYDHPEDEVGDIHKINGFDDKVFRKRTPNVPRLFWPNLLADDADVVEDYYRRLCVMFIKWRNEDEDLSHDGSYEQRWKLYLEQLAAHEKIEAVADIDLFIDRQNQRAEIDRLIKQRRGEHQRALVDEDIELDVADELVSYDRDVDAAAHQTNVERMNTAQRDIFNEVTEAVAVREALSEDLKKNADAMRLFVTGTAGTGKSFLINALADEITVKYTTPERRAYRPAVLIAAPTGLAAVQIKGSTIHSLFSIGVQKGRNQKFSAMNARTLNLKRTLFENVKLIIIDEISMCSSVLLTKIHMRLEEVFPGTGKVFGGRHIVSFGDLMQLPPVLASPVFKRLTTKEIVDNFNSVAPPFELWTQFEYRELTENMRQKDDLEFANLMGRMRVGNMTPEDNQLLNERVLKLDNQNMSIKEAAQFYVKTHVDDPFAMALFSHNESVRDFNRLVVEEMNLEAVEVLAEDSHVKTQRADVRRRTYQRKEYQLEVRRHQVPKAVAEEDLDDKEMEAKTGGMQKRLLLAENSRVMLRRTVDAAKGLVNGATGVLKRIVRVVDGYIEELNIDFDRGVGLQNIRRTSAIFETGLDKKVSRSQFPVMLSFGATIHKCQGLTLENAIISTSTIFANAQAYVAMSRVVNINGLHLLDYSEDCVKISEESLIEYNRLRETIALEPFVVTVKKPKEARSRFDKPADVTQVIKITPRRKNTRKPEVKALTPQEEAKDVQTDNRRVFDDEDEDDISHPLLYNTGDDCFLMAACQLLYAMDMAIALRNSMSTCPVLQSLKAVLCKETRTVTELRSRIQPCYRTGEKSASACLLAMIAAYFDEDLCATFLFEEHTEKICRCPALRDSSLRNYHSVQLTTLNKIGIPSIRFGDLIAEYTKSRTACSRCLD